jgi:steroid delta-isomerase-like uncharacterized protein
MPSDIKALARRWFEEVWNQARDATIDELIAPDCVAHGLEDSGKDMPGPQFRRFYRQFVSGFPDVKISVDQVIAEGDTTAVRITARATHSGDGLGISATGRKVTVSGICMMRWRDGKIVEAWNEFDAAGLLRQIGAGEGTGGGGNAKVKA